MPEAGCSECIARSHLRLTPSGVSPATIAVVDGFPTDYEARSGKAYYGDWAKVLRSSLVKGGFEMDEVYWTHACLCKVPKDKLGPLASYCQSRLRNELAEVQPKVVLTLGAAACDALLGPSSAKFDHRRGVYKNGVLPTLHPRSVVREPEDYRDLADDIQLARRIADGEEVVIEPPYDDYVAVSTRKQLDDFILKLGEQRSVAIDIETDGLDYLNGIIRLIGFSWGEGVAYIVPWSLLEQNPGHKDRLRMLLSRLACSFQHGQFDVPWLQTRGFPDLNYAFDTMLAHFLLDERQAGHHLQGLAVKYCKAPDWKTQLSDRFGRNAFATVPYEELVRYNGADVDYTYRLSSALAQGLRDEGLVYAMTRILVPAARHFTKLRVHGMLIDKENLEALGDDLRTKIAALEAELHAFEGAERINLQSNDQLAVFLYDTLHLNPFGGERYRGAKKIPEHIVLDAIQSVDDPEAHEYWRSKRGVIIKSEDDGFSPRATDAYALWWLAQQHDFPRVLLRYRKLIKQYSSYYERILGHMAEDGRVRPYYRLFGAKTGRVSSTDPAIHNLPRDERIWNCFRAAPGNVLVYADYSQVELRVAAHLSGEPEMIRLLNAGDIHTETAKALYRCSDAEWGDLDPVVRNERRTAAKGISFGLLYGRSAKGLAPQLGVSLSEAQAYIDRFYAKMPQLRRWIERQKRIAVREHEVVSMFGRRRRFPLIKDRFHQAEVERQGTNMPVQSSASDITLLAHIRIVERLEQEGIEVYVWPHIHDSLTVEVPEEHQEYVCRVVRETMEDVPFESAVKFGCDLKTGVHWGTMRKVKDVA